MMASEHIIKVTEADFEYEVIQYSRQVPVVVDFWAEWCGPCRMLGPLLERLTQEADGAFRLAKVNVDESPNLAARFGVRSIPSVKAFQDGQVVSDFVGAQPEARVREFLKALAPSEMDLTFEKAQGMLILGKFSEAEGLFRKFLEKVPNHPVASLGLIRSLLMQGYLSESRHLLRNFPPSKEYASAEILNVFANALARVPDAPPFQDNPIDAAYMNALRLAFKGNLEAAMDGMLDVLRHDKHYRGGDVRRVMLGIFELIGEENGMVRQYRNELASVLF